MVFAHTLVEDSVWLSADVRSMLMLLVVVLVVVLIVGQFRVRARMRIQAATIAAMLAETERRATADDELIKALRQNVTALAELNGHAEVAFGRTRLSPESRELLEQAERADAGRGPSRGAHSRGEPASARS